MATKARGELIYSRSWVFHVGAGNQRLGSSSVALLRYKEGASSEVEHPGLESVPLWDFSADGRGPAQNTMVLDPGFTFRVKPERS